MAAFTSIFGAKLQGKDGPVDTESALADKVVGIYFSAHWCPPCRGFTPKLAEQYSGVLKGKGMEIVFVSSDKDEASFKSYYDEMPWLALPYADREKKNSLSKKFKVQGIPSFIILDKDGSTITTDGRSKVMGDPTAEDFPWRPKPWAEVIGDTFLKGSETVGKEALAGKTIAIYFSAHWCPPCRQFTPKLAAQYKLFKEKGLPLEVIFSTGDRDEESFKSYYDEMIKAGGDWLAIPYADEKRRNALDALFEVSGIPTLVIVDENGTIINKNARGAISSDPNGDKFPWAPPLVKNLSEPEGIDENLSLCVFAEALPAKQQEAIESLLEPISKSYVDKAKAAGDDPEVLFFVAKNSEGPVPKIRDLCKLGTAPSLASTSVATKGETSAVGLVRSISNDLAPPVAQMVLLDIPDNGGFYVGEMVELTAQAVEDFIAAYKSKSLDRKQLG